MRSAAQEANAAALANAGRLLQQAGGSLAVAKPGIRAIIRLAALLARPMRIAVMGEANSGKSTLVNLLLGDATLPTLPFANTRLPTLLRHAPVPAIHGRAADGQLIELDGEAGFDAANLLRLEVSLPSPFLRTIELIDFPGMANPALGWTFDDSRWLRADGTIWATVATQAWRESERAAWQLLPPRMRANSLLTVTHCDLIRSKAELQALKQRLLPIASELFGDILFVAAARETKAAPPSSFAAADRSLFAAVDRMRTAFQRERAGRAIAMAARVAGRLSSMLEITDDIDTGSPDNRKRNGTPFGSGASMSNGRKDDDIARVRDVLQKLQTLHQPHQNAPTRPADAKHAEFQLDILGRIMERKQAALEEMVPRKTLLRRKVAVYAAAFALIAALVTSITVLLPLWQKNDDEQPAATAKNVDMMKILSDARTRLVNGDTLAARNILKDGATQKAEFAFLLAQSYDPNYLQSLPKRNAAPDRDQAERWYREWYDLATRSGLSLDPARLQRIINAMPPQK